MKNILLISAVIFHGSCGFQGSKKSGGTINEPSTNQSLLDCLKKSNAMPETILHRIWKETREESSFSEIAIKRGFSVGRDSNVHLEELNKLCLKESK